jgi:hypothetical protein
VPELTDLAIEWATVPDVAEALDVEVTKVRQHLREGKLLAVRREPDAPLTIPAAFVQDGVIVKHLPGVITLLRDARFADDEAIRWLFTDDDLPGSPIEALRANRGTEVKRRAQALGF